MKLLVFLFTSLLPLTLFSQSKEVIPLGKLSPSQAKVWFGEDPGPHAQYAISKELRVDRPGIWLWVERNDGVCHTEWVYGFSEAGSVLAQLQMVDQCDHDGSRACYHTMEGAQLTHDPVFEQVHLEVWVADRDLHLPPRNGMRLWTQLKPGVSFHDDGLEFRELSYTKYFTLDQQGEFVPIAPDTTIKSYRRYPPAHYRLLTEVDLAAFSKAELRLIRNEIFADYGYRFRSEDLQLYFSGQSWYRPLTSDAAAVATRLNWLETQNVALIQQLEARK